MGMMKMHCSEFKASLGYIISFIFKEKKGQEKSFIRNINFTKGITISETLKTKLFHCSPKYYHHFRKMS